MKRLVISPDDIERVDMIEHSAVYSNVVTALVAGSQVAIHRPCFYKIDKLHNDGKLFYSSKNVLDLIDQGHIVVGAREGWFDRSFRENNEVWGPNYPWTEADSKVAEWAAADATLADARTKRAIVTPSPRGNEYADEQLQNPEIYKFAENLLENNEIPAGLAERANHSSVIEKGKREQIKVIVRDAFNNVKLIEDLHSDVPIRQGDHFENIDLLGRRPKTSISSGKDYGLRYEELIDAISALREFRNFDEFSRFLNSPQKATIVRGLSGLLRAENVIAELREQHATAISIPGWKEVATPENPQFLRAVATFGISLILGLNPINSFVLATATLVQYEKLLKKIGWADMETPGIEYINLLLSGKKSLRIDDLLRNQERLNALGDEDRRAVTNLTKRISTDQKN